MERTFIYRLIINNTLRYLFAEPFLAKLHQAGEPLGFSLIKDPFRSFLRFFGEVFFEQWIVTPFTAAPWRFVGDVADCFFFSSSSFTASTLLVINCYCFPWPVRCLIVTAPLVPFFFQDILNWCIACAQCLCNGL